jgi:nicotinamidase-related amidase
VTAFEDEWLLVIDMQRVFADPPSPWIAPEFYRILPNVERLVDAFRGRVVLTRYVAPRAPSGAWVSYFAAYPSALRPPDDPIWDLKLAARAGDFVETRTTFAKWDDRMARRVGQDSALIVCGVATECCVLSTVLRAVDDGRRVRVVTDACAGGAPGANELTWSLLAGYSPMAELATTDQILAERS